MLYFQARVADETECYREMVAIVTPILEKKAELYKDTGVLDISSKESDFFTKAFKGLVEPQREAIKTLVALLHGNAFTTGDPRYADGPHSYDKALGYYKNMLYQRLKVDCETIIKTIGKVLE